MTQSHEARQVLDALAVLEDRAGHAIALALIYPSTASTGRDTASILSTVLEKVQGIMQVDCSRCLKVGKQHTDDTAHCV